MKDMDVMLEPLRAFVAQVSILLPRLALALAVVLVGWVIAKAARFVVAKALRAVNFNVVTERAGMDGFLRNGGIRADTTALLALLAYWGVILAALVLAFNTLGMSYVTDLLTRLVVFVPRLMVALLILALGAYFARFVGGAIAAALKDTDPGSGSHVPSGDADVLGRLAQYAITVFAALIALDTLDVGGDLIRQTFLIVLAGVVFALALAFGLGGRDWAAEILERLWPRRK
jgi:hypothetical protein